MDGGADSNTIDGGEGDGWIKISVVDGGSVISGGEGSDTFDLRTRGGFSGPIMIGDFNAAADLIWFDPPPCRDNPTGDLIDG